MGNRRDAEAGMSFRTPIHQMDDIQKDWFATAMVAVVLADGNVSQGEVESLMNTISFLHDPEVVDRLKKFLQYQTPPPLSAFIGWEKELKNRAAMLLDLIEVAVADRDFSEPEKEKFYEIGKILGFPTTKIDELIAMGHKFMEALPE